MQLTLSEYKGLKRVMCTLYLDGDKVSVIAKKCWKLGGGKSGWYQSKDDAIAYIDGVKRRGALQCAVEWLSKMDMTKKTLVEKIIDLGVSSVIALHCVEKIQSTCRVCDDQRFAQRLMEQCIRKGKGRMWFKQKCFEKKVDTTISSQLSETYDEKEAYQHFERLHQSKSLDRLKKMQKMKQAGFCQLSY